MDSLVRTKSMDWVELKPDAAYMKVLSAKADSGRWTVLLRWRKGHVAPPHKHLSAAQTYNLSGKLQIRDEVIEEGDYLYQANEMIHDETVALEDTPLLFVCDGPIIYFDDNSLTGYLGWEQIKRLSDPPNPELNPGY